MSNWQTYAALAVVAFAVVVAARTLVWPFVRAFKSPENIGGGCGGGCSNSGCSTKQKS